MALWIFFSFACVAVIALNIAGSLTALRSKLDTKNKKQLYLLLIWLVPVLGVISATLLISHDMKKTKNKNDEELVTALNDFAKRVNAISDGIKKKRGKDNTLH